MAVKLTHDTTECQPRCATETTSDNKVVKWGLCLPDCPTIEPEVACLDDPIFPDWVRASDRDAVNFTATLQTLTGPKNFDQDVGTVVLELDYVEFTCPVGYIFEVRLKI